VVRLATQADVWNCKDLINKPVLLLIFMRAYFGATGLSVCLGEEDKVKIGEGKDLLECEVDEANHPRVFLYVRDGVESGTFEESGFHMQCYPDEVNFRESLGIYVFLSKERWNSLTTVYDKEADGGFFASRCLYDRCHFHYWDDELVFDWDKK